MRQQHIEWSEKEIFKKFTIASENKILGINLTKDVKDLCTKNCKKLKTQVNKKISYVYGSKELISLKCPHHLKPSTDSMQLISEFQ